MATIGYRGKSVTIPQCKECGSDLRFKGIYDCYNFINGEKVTMRCSKCKAESKEQVKC